MSRILKTIRAAFTMLKPAEVSADIAEKVLARQLTSIERVVSLIVLGCVISMWAVLHSFWETNSQGLLVIWACVLSVLIVYSGVRYAYIRARKEAYEYYSRRLELIHNLAKGFGLIWGLAPIIVIPTAAPMEQMALGIVLVGLMFCGGFLLGRIPQAAFSFVAPIAICFTLSLQFNYDPQNGYLSVLMLVYVGFLALNIRWTHNHFIEQVSSGEAVKQQSELIGLLLKDFEQSTSDWLWQTDENGALAEIPMSIGAKKSEYTIMQLGLSLTDLFCDGPAFNILKSSLDQHKDFRELVVKVNTDDEEMWWSITGKPIYEDNFFAGFRGVASDVTQSKKTEDRIAYMAHYDGLTGLPNRASLHEALEKMLQKSAKPDVQRAIVWLDLDKFKWVNDTLGHAAGDELLKVVAERLRAVTNKQDVTARLSGDEFAVLLERPIKSDQVAAFAEQLSNELSATYDIAGSTVNCSASIGVRLVHDDERDSAVLMKHADLALYHSKAEGAGTWTFFEQFMEDEVERRREMELDLRRALERNELRVHFQPLVHACTHEISSCETLLRWQHPTRGLIYPGDFIEYAEDCGLITKIGEWVIKAAIENAARMPSHVKVAINVSPVQIHSASLMTTIFKAISEYAVDPRRIVLEITESVLMTNSDFTLGRLHDLKKMGFQIALDDFGTGYSSLSYLHSFPFDKIKIDKCFISDLETNEDNRKITIATLNLANSLGLHSTAEGIETMAQAEFLNEHGCDELQGYFFSKPRPIEELTDFMAIKDEKPAASDPLRAVST